MIINIIFVSKWHFAVVSILFFARGERDNEGKKRQVPSEKGWEKAKKNEWSYTIIFFNKMTL